MKMLAVALLTCLTVSCTFLKEQDTKVSLQGGERPTFVFSGTGTIDDFIIYGPHQREGKGGDAYTVWEIRSAKGFGNGRSVSEIGSIEYGIVPDGYGQIYPEENAKPPSVIAGTRYVYWAQTTNAEHAREEFELINGKATWIPGNGVKPN